PPWSTLFPYTTLFRSLAARQPAGLRVGQVEISPHGGPQPAQTALGGRQQLLRVAVRQPPAAGLRQQHGEEECGLRPRAAGREVRDRKSTRLNSSHVKS